MYSTSGSCDPGRQVKLLHDLPSTCPIPSIINWKQPVYCPPAIFHPEIWFLYCTTARSLEYLKSYSSWLNRNDELVFRRISFWFWSIITSSRWTLWPDGLEVRSLSSQIPWFDEREASVRWEMISTWADREPILAHANKICNACFFMEPQNTPWFATKMEIEAKIKTKQSLWTINKISPFQGRNPCRWSICVTKC